MSIENDAIDLGARRKQKADEERAQVKLYEKDLADCLVERHGADLRYVAGFGKWLKWDGKCWREDDTQATFDLAATMCKEMSDAGQQGARKGSLKTVGTVSGVVRFAAADRRCAATVDQWDADPWLLGTPDGTIDLRTGETHAPKHDHYITKATAVAPGGDCPRWLKFVDEITAGDSDLAAYLQRLAGCCLTGIVRDHALIFLYGDGGNGKGVFIETLSGVLGRYAETVAMTTLLVMKQQEHATEIAKLRGARIAVASESQDGARWNAARIKLLTGGDTLTGRFMRQDFFRFAPTHKLIVLSNAKPALGRVDDAISRRTHLVPFRVKFGKPDLELLDKLKREWPGILNWMIKGCLEWQRIGLAPPKAVVEATKDYLQEMDDVARWLDERCHEAPNLWEPRKKLYDDWRVWCDVNGAYSGGTKDFYLRLEARGFRRRKTGGERIFQGLCFEHNYNNQKDGPPPEDDPMADAGPEEEAG